LRRVDCGNQYREGDYDMADQEHENMLRRGVETWNHWRKEHPEIRPDLSGVAFRGAVDDPYDGYLAGINLSETLLKGADLSDVLLRGADLSGADLSAADLGGANLQEANLSGAILVLTLLVGCDIKGADLQGAIFGDSTIARVDLSSARNLETAIHRCPSIVGVDAIRLTADALRAKGTPKIEIANFLRRAGVPDDYCRVLL
jgi:hypothetical protein